MQTSYMLVMELCDLLGDCVIEHINAGRYENAVRMLEQMKAIRQNHLCRTNRVLGLQELAHKVSQLQSELKHHVKPSDPPDLTTGDGQPPLPNGDEPVA